MRILVATDAWSPQVNGVVRTLQSLAANVRKLGAEIEFLAPEGFRTFPLPTDWRVRCAIPTWREIARRIELAAPDALHIATEGPIGHVVRRYCLARQIPFTTAYMTRFPEYVSARLPVPLSWSYAVLRRFHAAAAVTMVSTRSLLEDLDKRGFAHLAMWTRGVDTDLFRPDRAIAWDLPRPIFVSVGRIAIEKNLPAFLAARSPRLESHHWRRAAGGRAATALSRSPFSW
jgi:glycosyltransferase involved in cell wall biosynthesis